MRRDRPGLRRTRRTLLLAGLVTTLGCRFEDRAVPCDADGDGHSIARCGGDDCDDANASIYPGAADPLELVWAVETVPSTSFGHDGFALGADDRPYVLFSEFTPTEACPVPNAPDALPFCEWSMVLARRSSGTWERVYAWDDEDSDYPDPGIVALALSRGRIHIVPQYRWSTEDVIDWRLEPVPPPPDGTSVGFGSGDFAADRESGTVAFNPGLRVALHSPEGPWSWEVIDTDVSGETPPIACASVAWDVAGGLHAGWITYPVMSPTGWYEPAALRYARRTASGWSVESIEGAEVPGAWCNLAVAPDATARLSYLRSSPAGTSVAEVASNASGSWLVESVYEEVTAVARAPEDWIAVEPDGTTHVAVKTRIQGGASCPLVDVACGALVHGTDRGGAWTFEEVTSGQCWGSSYTLALDATGRAHILFEVCATDSPWALLEARHAFEIDAVDEGCDGP